MESGKNMLLLTSRLFLAFVFVGKITIINEVS